MKRWGLIKTNVADSDTWAFDKLERKQSGFRGYTVVLLENWVYPNESKDFPTCPHGKGCELDGTTEMRAMSRTLVPATAVKLFGCMLDRIAGMKPSLNTYSVAIYHRTYYCKGESNHPRKVMLYSMKDLKGGTRYPKPNLDYNCDTGEFTECEK